MATPLHELEARGSREAYKRKAHAKTHPKPPSSCPDPPSWLSPAALALWEEHIDVIYELGALTTLDVIAMGQLFTAMAEHQEHAASVVRDGAVIEREHYCGPHPEAKLRDEAAKRVVVLLRQCGLTRWGRSGMSLEPPGFKMGEIVDKRGGFAT